VARTATHGTAGLAPAFELRLLSRLVQLQGLQLSMADWIASDARLDEALRALPPGPVALDTEFIREKTYYPQLALLQVAAGDRILLIDPLALDQAAGLRALLQSPALKLMHSPSEDLQALKRSYDLLPRPLFDTQSAAALVGLGAGLGYQALIERLLGIRLEKGETRSDWMRRPLSEAQLHYAADDVRHLAAAHALLAERLEALGRSGWHAEECERQLAAAERDDNDPHPHLSNRAAQRMRPQQQMRLRRLMQWRDEQARRSDKPKSWILDNELVVDLAIRGGGSRSEFEAYLDGRPRAPRRQRDELFDLLARPATPEEADLPLAEAPDPAWREPLRKMQEQVAAVATGLELPEGLLCARRHLETLIATRRWPAALDGWRRPLLEPVLAPVLERTSQGGGGSV
jgi:ribonuclease D